MTKTKTKTKTKIKIKTKTMTKLRMFRSVFLLCVLLPLMFLLASCVGDSGQSTEGTINTSQNDPGDGSLVYLGPPAQTDDIQRFKENVWDNLAASNRCGACHNQEFGQEPFFVRLDDVNLAYSVALNLVDLQAPVLSRLVEKVGTGHNCWLANAQACADTVERFISAWSTASGASANVIVLTPPNVKNVGTSLRLPGDSGVYAQTVYPLVTGEANCVNCHSEGGVLARQQPFFASSNVDNAYQAARTLIDLSSPSRSRFVERMQEQHNCWADPTGAESSNCVYSRIEIQDAIEAMIGLVPPPAEVDPQWVISDAIGLLDDGIIASSGGRVETNVIAVYQFKEGAGGTAFDTSGVEPLLNLNITDEVEWVGSWGIRIIDGKAQADTASSKKLYDLIRATGEYSIEAWVIPGNVSQEGPARIVTYAGGSDEANFMLGQTLYDYDFLSRSSNTGADGSPALSTPSADEVLQASLQHVVVNYDVIDGRQVFVNGELVAQDDPASDTLGGDLNEWDDGFAFAVGNEVDNQQQWQGTVRFLAIHNRILTEEQIVANFDVGVGQKYFMLFGVSRIGLPQSELDKITAGNESLVDWTLSAAGIADAYIVFETEVFDDFSYQFNAPFFISLDRDAVPSRDIRIKGMRLGLNGKEVAVGQLYSNVDMTVTAGNYNSETGVPLVGTPSGTIIGVEDGAADDQFFLTFEEFGGVIFDRPADEVPDLPAPVDLPVQADVGLRVFSEINASMSAVTGVRSSSVSETYSRVIRQLPPSENADAFLASHQSGIMQLALAYCSGLSADTGLRAQFYPGLDFNAPALDSEIGRNNVIQPLLDALIVNEGLASQPDAAAVSAELHALIGAMTGAPSTTIITAVCTASLGGATTLLQ